MEDQSPMQTTIGRPSLELDTTSKSHPGYHSFSPTSTIAQREEYMRKSQSTRQFFDPIRPEPPNQRQEFRPASQDTMMQGRSPESVRTTNSQSTTLPPFSALDLGSYRGSQRRSPTAISSKSPTSSQHDYPSPFYARSSVQDYHSVYAGSSPASTQNITSPRDRYMQVASGQSPSHHEGHRYRESPGQMSMTDMQTPQSASTQATFSSLSNSRPTNNETKPASRGDQSPILNTAGSIASGMFPCPHEDCADRPAFPTQYLLSSHQNVHKPDRPYYCPVKDCPRSANGKPNSGFKRKNELIRHQLVHNSPGYACPFCPDRDHKYPRPDNLQRHVKVHHTDKSKDDPQLRAILSQRIDSDKSGRRRRVNSTT